MSNSTGLEKRLGLTVLTGGYAKVIIEIAKRRYGGYRGMFEAHGWPERGSGMMCKVQSRVCEKYGSVRAFEDFHKEPGH